MARLRWLVVIGVVLSGVVACKDKAQRPGPAASTAKPDAPASPDLPDPPDLPPAADAGAAAVDHGDDAVDHGDDAVDHGDDAVDYGDDAVASVCERADACKCPVPDCRVFFTDIGMADSIYECLAAQPCDALCAPRAGAPGTPLHAACIEGKAGGGGGGVTSACRTDNDCPGQHECCGGYCYELGTSLWITACQMPTGEF